MPIPTPLSPPLEQRFAHTASGPEAGAENAADNAPATELEHALQKAGSSRKKRVAFMLLVLLAAASTAFAWRFKTKPVPPPRYVCQEVSRGDVLETVQATGQAKPLTEVQVGAQVSGRIANVYVDFNSTVHAGQVLAEIDPRLYGAQIASTTAQLEAARANLLRAEAAAATTKQKLDRAKRLVAEGIGSQADLDALQGAYEVANADSAAARAQVRQGAGQLESSRTNLEYTKIVSPIDGMVISRAIDPGQTVAASFQAPTLFVIARDLRKMRVFADVDEADVGKLRQGMAADVSVDAFSGDVFHATLNQIRFSPLNVSGVVTYAAVLDVDNPELKLRPGMTATVTFRAREARSALRIPNAALRFKPSPIQDKDGKSQPPEPAPAPALGPHQGRVHVLTDATPGAEKVEARIVEIGLTDGAFTVLLSDLSGAKIVTDESDESLAKKQRGPRLF